MAKLCYDKYEHPLLWCESKRRAEEKRIADESLALLQQQKIQTNLQKNREYYELRELIEKHYPWGKPGGGAPNKNIRRKDLVTRGLFAEPDYNCRKYTTAPICPSKRGLSSITFNNSTRKHPRIATKKLNKMELNRAEQCGCGNTNNNRPDLSTVCYKSVAAGAPWRNPRKIGQSFMKSMGWTDKSLLETLDPVSHNKVTNSFNSSGDQANAYTNKPNETVSNQIKLPSQQQQQQHQISHEKADSSLSHRKNNHENSSRLCVHTNGCAKKCKYVTGMITGGVELVPLLARRRAMQRPISLSTTDVTKYSTEKKWQDCGDRIQLLDDLCRQVSQKKRKKQMCRDKELESARRHFETIDTFWGRPGHGAPIGVRTKSNLNELLYSNWT